ncbi:PREDICTED: abhydrolase domain-containing protein 16A isoform X2 [Wasmannia auropunctata]|uniref:abhydrolase domain-containing protein 16A isoform X2 n=1 Tax=Wasmannia auropunctata TaxID=64793 RepID=UPI0005EE8068|nr:PREDICTED: abhydrolase domain-containing protein 16A isoform X2 [Wasmannia auropunctata]
MSLIRTLWRCTFSPRLFKIYEKSYEARSLERWGDQIVISFAAIWSISLYAVPVIAMIAMYHRGYSLTDNASYLSKWAASAGAILVASLAARGYSRVNNPQYVKFVETLNEAHLHYNASAKQELHKYDFEFWAWPVEFNVSKLSDTADKLTLEKIAKASGRLRRQSGKEFLFAIPCKLLSYVVAHTFAGKLIYPGSVSFVGWAFGSTLAKGRADLIKQGGERYKLMTTDKNQIDAMFVDRRNKSANGNMLVVICEGNCGFYETGMISTPLTKGYSVLGWNHPGFGGSTGAPYPEQEENAVDCIMRFAIEHLKFPEERIILYGWSIGGYTATWAAMNYPSIHSLVLDATFDDILPLAIKTMSPSLEGLVRNIIRDYFNLNIAEQLNRYNGTVLLVRRTDDEILCIPHNSLAGNRGNMLLMKLLLRRYPHLFSETSESGTVLSRFLSAEASDRTSILESFNVEEKHCLQLIASNIRSDDGVINYPSTLGQNCNIRTKSQLILFLATMYMQDQSTSHCLPLSVDLFHPGWDPASAIAVE